MVASTAAERSPNAPELEPTLRQIAGFADLEPGWDSYGGDPPSPIARSEAVRWVEIVADLFEERVGNTAIPYSVAPLANGGIQVEWRGRGGTVELEIGSGSELGYLFRTSAENGDQTEEGDGASWSDVLRALSGVFTEDTETVVFGSAHKEYSVKVRIDRIERGTPLIEI